MFPDQSKNNASLMPDNPIGVSGEHMGEAPIRK